MGVAIGGARARSPLYFSRCTAVRATPAYTKGERPESNARLRKWWVCGPERRAPWMQRSQRYAPPLPQPMHRAGSTSSTALRQTVVMA